jgi:hypothetical protein
MSQETPETPMPTDQQMQVISEEVQRLQTLYLDARNNAQTVFNFYLTFVTAITGGLIFVVQSASDIASLQTRLILIALLFFSVLVGSVYVSALSGRYAQANRYSYGLDMLRRVQLQLSKPFLPPVYNSFVNASTEPVDATPAAWYIWLFPTGTFQMFIAVVNSTSLSASIALILSMGAIRPQTILVMTLIVFLVTLTIYNVYSHLLIRRFTEALDIRIHMGHQLEIWAARE